MKLKKLIVSGFKSFADRTEFEFDDGISCIVGPNGCGKSNVVDAIKWVLGEQSAKSLRGSEMMDVIFNGSSGRKAAGGAEVTLVFDNSAGMLQPPGGTGEPPATLAITRRLYRDGVSEYLMNKASCRLKDIREMFMDTGVDAYSVIEQGRVEGFLQASQDDRRAIFDEAAGISKYKARKKEAIRKLERVEQNLLRVNDVLAEVEKRLRSIKVQAGKARNYQGYTERLKELRSLHLLAQYHQLRQQRNELTARLDGANDNLSGLSARLEKFEAAHSSAQVESVDLGRQARDLQGQVAAIGGQITASQQRADMMAARVKELGEHIVAACARGEELEAKIAGFVDTTAQRKDELSRMESESAQVGQRYEALRQQHHEGELEITRLTAAVEDEKAGTIDLLRRTAQLHNEINSLNIRRESLAGQRDRLSGRQTQIDEAITSTLAQRSEHQARLGAIKGVLGDAQQRLDDARRQSREVMDSEQSLRNQLSDVREQRSGVISRIKALDEMQKRLEGVGGGVRKVLQAHQQGKLPAIRGMLGDFIQTDTQHAPLVEAALAGADQHLVIDTLEQLLACQEQISAVLGNSGALELLCLDQAPAPAGDLDLSSIEGARGRVFDFVRCEGRVSAAAWSLLGRTIVVDDLSAAGKVRQALGEGYRFVTLAGQVLEADGRVRLGSAGRSAGVITRRSELAELAKRQSQLDASISELTDQCQQTHSQREHLEEVQSKLRTAIYEANTERVECESKLRQLNEQVEKLQREKPTLAREIESLAEQIDRSIAAEHAARDKAQQLEQQSTQRQAALEALNDKLSAQRAAQGQLSGKMTELKVALASAQEKQRSCREAIAAIARQSQQMEQDLASIRSQIELDRQRRSDAEAAITAAREEANRLFGQQETVSRELVEVEESQTSLAQRLEEIRKLMAEARKSHETASAQVGAIRVEAGEVDVRIEGVIGRGSDEMGMNLPELYKDYQHDEQRDWQEVEDEIKELRGKIERLGNVNLDAISEQDELEQRETFLRTQLADITSSQNQLHELIRRINKDSRDLFVKTFETVRANFQELFRKLFGGGKADIMLTDPEDVLESPIEIIARPPGKEAKSISLLSGGEKTMTALSLLFSIFKSRPSPFCLLDEVDAALDEANTERFSRLVREFNDSSQFIVISHAKRTMSMANVLYGVTMQEPGVSTRISVKFEDAANKLDSQLQPVSAN